MRVLAEYNAEFDPTQAHNSDQASTTFRGPALKLTDGFMFSTRDVWLQFMQALSKSTLVLNAERH